MWIDGAALRRVGAHRNASHSSTPTVVNDGTPEADNRVANRRMSSPSRAWLAGVSGRANQVAISTSISPAMPWPRTAAQVVAADEPCVIS